VNSTIFPICAGSGNRVSSAGLCVGPRISSHPCPPARWRRPQFRRLHIPSRMRVAHRTAPRQCRHQPNHAQPNQYPHPILRLQSTRQPANSPSPRSGCHSLPCPTTRRLIIRCSTTKPLRSIQAPSSSITLWPPCSASATSASASAVGSRPRHRPRPGRRRSPRPGRRVRLRQKRHVSGDSGRSARRHRRRPNPLQYAVRRDRSAQAAPDSAAPSARPIHRHDLSGAHDLPQPAMTSAPGG